MTFIEPSLYVRDGFAEGRLADAARPARPARDSAWTNCRSRRPR
ncbi:hypothetical protein ACIQNG_35575 [Streptomyces sp. NPDC091377]